MSETLGALQLWMQQAVTHPAGVNPANVGERIRPSGALTAIERLSIYNQSYHARLLDCFRSFYPALLHALGGDLFDQFALAYLKASPPVSFTLAQLTDSFPQWLKETRPADGEGLWPDFVIELASLELAFRQVYDGPGPEGPALRRFACRYPVHLYQAAVRRGEKPEAPPPSETFLALSRRNYRVVVREISRQQYKGVS